MKKLILNLILILLISGCVGSDIFSLFGGKKTEIKEFPSDVIVIQNINVLPSPPINTDDQFSVSFELNNQEEKDNVDINYELLDDGLCRTDSITLGTPVSIDDFVPGQTEFIEWTFDTPSSMDIGYLTTKCPIRFKVGYSFEAFSEIEVNVISDDRYNQLKQTGNFTTITPVIVVGRGPIKIYMEFGAALPIRTARTLPVYVTVEDKGAGLLTEIPERKLVIEIPDDFTFELGSCGGRFECSTVDGANICYNIQPLSIIKRKTPAFKCSFTTPTADDVVLEQTYFISAFFNYDYEVIEEVDVEIKPLPV